MLLKALAIVQSKAVLAVLGVVLVGGGGTAAAYAATSHPSSLTSTYGYGSAMATAKPTMATAKPAKTTTTPATATAKPAPMQGATSTRAHAMSIKGVLKSYNANAGTISVQVKGNMTLTTIVVNAKTRVNGVHARILGDLVKNIGHKVQVQANKQNDGKLVARNVTVQSAKGQGTGTTPTTGTIPDVGDSPAMGTTPTPTTGNNAGTGTIPDIGDSPAMGTTPATGTTPAMGNKPGMGNSHGNGNSNNPDSGDNSNG